MADRTPLLLLHGALGSRAQLGALAAALESRFAPYAFDFMGHGAAGLTGPLMMERLVDQAADYVRTHGLGPVAMFGYSMGGYVALQLAASRPELVRAVATLGTKLAWDPGVAVEVGARMNEETIASKVPKLAAALQLEHTGIGWERLCRESRDMLATLGERPLLTRESFAGIAQPVRLMVGDRDDTVTLEETLGTYELLPRGELEVLPRTGHPLQKVDVERLASSLATFFAG